MNGEWLFNPEAVAWVIAAEGTISVGKSSGKYYYPFIQVTNTSKDFIDKFLEMVDFGTVCSATKGDKYPSHKRCYIWSLRNLAGCLDLLKQILPSLPIKVEQAKLVIELCESRLANFHELGRDNLFDERELEIVNRIHELNRRGKKMAEKLLSSLGREI